MEFDAEKSKAAEQELKRQALDEMKREVKSELKAELMEDLRNEMREDFKAEYWVQRAELFETLHSLTDLLCSEFDESARPKVERCYQKLREVMSLEADEACEYLFHRRKNDEVG